MTRCSPILALGLATGVFAATPARTQGTREVPPWLGAYDPTASDPDSSNVGCGEPPTSTFGDAVVFTRCGGGRLTNRLRVQVPARLEQFLYTSIGLDSAQVQRVAGGNVVVKVLPTPIKRDVAVFGVIPLDVTREFYVNRVLHTATWLRAPTRPRFGVFSDPALPADVQGVTIDRADVQDLKTCRQDHCNVKLPASEMRRIRRAIDWSASNAGPQVDAYARQWIVGYVTAYRAHGDSALVEYDDRGHVRASDAFSSLLAESPYLFQYVAPFHQYLADYPHARLDGVRDVLYWSEDALPSLRPILSITHLSVYTPSDRPGTTVVAQKQIYADHFFEGVFDLTLVVDRPTSSGVGGIYLVVIRRYRFDNLSGGILNIRGRVIRKLADKMGLDLQGEKQVSEHEFGSNGESLRSKVPSTAPLSRGSPTVDAAGAE